MGHSKKKQVQKTPSTQKISTQKLKNSTKLCQEQKVPIRAGRDKNAFTVRSKDKKGTKGVLDTQLYQSTMSSSYHGAAVTERR